MSSRLLLLHAHPDDESITTGGLILWAIGQKAQVLAVTATAGECGEVLNSQVEISPTALAQLRATELNQALIHLGQPAHQWLGGFGRYRDSGMQGDLRNTDPAAFMIQPFNNLVAEFKNIVIDFQPDIVVTYEPGGGYGHPDHVLCNQIAIAAIEEISIKPRLLYPVFPVSRIDQVNELAKSSTAFFGEIDLAKMSYVVKDEEIDFEVQAPIEKLNALLSYRSQINPAGSFYQRAAQAEMAGLETEYFKIAEISKSDFAVLDRANPLLGLGCGNE